MPRRVFADRGEWYVSADDERSGEVRTFRIDRILSVEATGAVVAPSSDPLPAPGSWFDDAAVPLTLTTVPSAPGTSTAAKSQEREAAATSAT